MAKVEKTEAEKLAEEQARQIWDSWIEDSTNVDHLIQNFNYESEESD